MEQKKLDIIYQIIDKYAGIKNVVKTEETEIADDLGFSSITFFEMITELEDTLHFRVSERELQSVETIGDILHIVQREESEKKAKKKKKFWGL